MTQFYYRTGIKLLLIAVSSSIALFSHWKLSQPCVGTLDEIDCLYLEKMAIYDPLFYGSKWLTLILVIMLFIPWRTYKPWLLTVLPITLAVSLILITNISVFSSGILHISRDQMAVNCAVVLASLTFLFVHFHELYCLYKRKRY